MLNATQQFQQLLLFSPKHGPLLIQNLTIPNLTDNTRHYFSFSKRYPYQHNLTFKQLTQQSSKKHQQLTIFSKSKAYYQASLSSQQSNTTASSNIDINYYHTPTQLQIIKDEVKNAIIL